MTGRLGHEGPERPRERVGGTVVFRPYGAGDRARCLELFDANCPESFAPNERGEYEAFLGGDPVGYEVCTLDGEVVGAFGLMRDRVGGAAVEPHTGERSAVGDLRWILIDPGRQGLGLGSAIMGRVREVAIQAGRTIQPAIVRIAASHRSAPFFARFGAEVVLEIPDGWGPGMHRVNMELPVGEGA